MHIKLIKRILNSLIIKICDVIRQKKLPLLTYIKINFVTKNRVLLNIKKIILILFMIS